MSEKKRTRDASKRNMKRKPGWSPEKYERPILVKHKTKKEREKERIEADMATVKVYGIKTGGAGEYILRADERKMVKNTSGEVVAVNVPAIKATFAGFSKKFETDNEEVQRLLENHPHFKAGVIFLIAERKQDPNEFKQGLTIEDGIES